MFLCPVSRGYGRAHTDKSLHIDYELTLSIAYWTNFVKVTSYSQVVVAALSVEVLPLGELPVAGQQPLAPVPGLLTNEKTT